MNSVVIANPKKSRVPKFVKGELVVSVATGNVVCVCPTADNASSGFNGMILFSNTSGHVGCYESFAKENFELFDQVLELSNE